MISRLILQVYIGVATFAIELLVERLRKLLQTPLPPHIEKKTDDAGRTVLHLALLHRMPKQFILLLVGAMKQSELDIEDNRGRCAIDYLLDWEDISEEILKSFIAQGVDLSEERDCLLCHHPLIRLCNRTVDGCELLKLVDPNNMPQDFKNQMLEVAVKKGSSSTVEYLLKIGADPSSRRYLLHSAAEANHDSIKKVHLLTKCGGGLDLSQVKEGQTLVHVAAGEKPPNTDLLLFALENGVDPNQKDLQGDTALHKVTENYSKRPVPWQRSEQAMKLLLRHPEINPNIQNSRGSTSLEILASSKATLPDALLWLWIKAGADCCGSSLGKCGPKSLLADISRRPDGCHMIENITQRQGKEKLQEHLTCMLEEAIESGQADTVKVLLDMDSHNNVREHGGRLLMIAARSNIKADVKLRYLLEKGADPTYRDPKKKLSVVHAVVQSPTATEKALLACTSNIPVWNLHDLKDKEGNTPLHLAARATHSSSAMFLGKLLEFEDANKLNDRDESPLSLVLQYNHSHKELRRNKVVLLLVNGCRPRVKDLEGYKGDADDFESLFLSTVVLTKIQDHLRYFLVLASYCKKRSEEEEKKVMGTLDWTQTQQWTNLNDYKIEETAIKMIEESGQKMELDGWEMTVYDFQDIHELGWREFLSNKNVGIVLERAFFGDIDISTTEKRWRQYYWLPLHIFRRFLWCLLFPVFMLITACFPRYKKKSVDPRRLPVVTYYCNMVSYMAFLGLLIAHVIEDSPHPFFSWSDWILLLYVVAMVAEEIYQMKRQGRLYVTAANGFDVLMIIFLFMFFVFRIVGHAKDDLEMYRASEHMFAVAAALSFLRLLFYVQVIRKLGPILISFKKIYKEVVSFTIILFIVLFAFAIALTVVYNSGVYTQEFQNGNISLPYFVSGIWPTLRLLYWSLYGQIEFQELESEYEILRPESVFGTTLFALWSLLSTIVLLNMLIALIDEAFDKVKKQNACLVWNLAVYYIIKDIQELPSFPLPTNLFYFASIAFKMNIYDPNWRPSLRANNSVYTKQPEKFERYGLLQNMEFIAELQPEEDKTAQTLKCVGNLESQLSNLKTELSRGMKTFRCQTKKRFSKQTRSVRRCLRLFQSHLAENSATSDHDGRNYTHTIDLVINSDSDSDFDSGTDSDSDRDVKDRLQVRHDRVTYDESPFARISYEGTGELIGGCQFLNKPISRTFHYFEVKVVDYGRDGTIGIGLAHSSYPLDRMPGWNKGSIAYHCDTGQIFYGHRKQSDTASPAQQGDILGCGIMSYVTGNGFEDTPVVFFTRNGEELGRKKVKFPKTGFFPIVGLHSQWAKLEVNWNTEWKSSETGYLLDISTNAEINVDALKDKDVRLYRLQSADFEVKNNSETAQQKPSRQDADLVRRSELVWPIGNKFFKYGSDINRGVGVYQSLQSMSTQFSYYEVTVKANSMHDTIAVGLAPYNYPLNTSPGLRKGSIAWHCDDSGLYVEKKFRRPLSHTQAKAGDRIGCGIDFEGNERKVFDRQLDSAEILRVYFTYNGVRTIEETIEKPEGGLFPTVGMGSPGEMVEINLDVFMSTVPACLRQVRAERVTVHDNFVSFVNNKDVGGIQVMQRNMEEQKYFEVTLISTGERSTISIGVAWSDYPLDRQPGWGNGSIAYRCDNGCLYHQGKATRCYPSAVYDVIGCGIQYDYSDQQHVFFTQNGKMMGMELFQALPPTNLYPTVCMHSPGEKVQINMNAQWNDHLEERREERLFRRMNHIHTDGNKAFYKPEEDTEVVGVVQLTREISQLYPYFEVQVTGFGKKGFIGVGLAPANSLLDSQPGWRPYSVGYHCNDGCLFEGVYWKGKQVRPPGHEGDRIGCGLKNPENIRIGQEVVVFFTHNEEEVCQSKVKWPRGRMLPTIGMQSRGEAITVITDAKWPRAVPAVPTIPVESQV